MQPSLGCLSCRAGPCTPLCDIPALLLGGPVWHCGWGAGLRDSPSLLHCQAPNTGGFHISPWMWQDQPGSPGSWGSAGGRCPEGWGCPPARRQCLAFSQGQLSLPGDGHSPELPVTRPLPLGSCAGVGGGRALCAAVEQPALPSHRVSPGHCVQPRSGRYGAPWPTRFSWGPGCNPVPNWITSGGGGKCCAELQAVGASSDGTASLWLGPAAAALPRLSHPLQPRLWL